jgi:phosphonopyruvate decarboxylase
MTAEQFLGELHAHGIHYFAGVPDSLLKDFCAHAEQTPAVGDYTICANEGLAVSLAAGYQMATGGIPLVFLQNSGLGNTINPVLSLIHPNVYRSPMLFLVGWRGEPGTKDEPQHRSQGEATLPLLDALGIRHAVLGDEASNPLDAVRQGIDHVRSTNESFAWVVRKGALESESARPRRTAVSESPRLTRERAIELVCGQMPADALVVASTGMISRELYSLREGTGEGHARDFLTVGSMGHCSTIALGLALNRPDRTFYCLDGDGALLMHMGGMALIGRRKPANLTHVVLNNFSHDSVGGQPTGSELLDIPAIARACGYAEARRVTTPEELASFLGPSTPMAGPRLLEVVVRPGHRNDLPRPREAPEENKTLFIQRLRQEP